MFPKCADTFKLSEQKEFGVEPEATCDVKEVCCRTLPGWLEIVANTGSGGYRFRTTTNVVKMPCLPSFICAIDGDQGHRPYMEAVKDRTWAVKFQRAIAGDLNNTGRLKHWRHRQGIPEGKRLVLHQESDDADLERFHKKTLHPNFFSILRASPNTICVSPGYSVYDDGSMCRHQQLLNMKRSFDFFILASDNGVPCIPCLGWNLREDLSRIAQWINAHPKLCYVAINAQTLRRDQFTKLCRDMTDVERDSRPLRWVVFGGRRVVEHLNGCGFNKRLTLITAMPIQRARAGRAIDTTFHSDNKIELFLYNHATMQARCTGRMMGA